uniref:Flocculation protein FLO11 n=1 Tax=Panagrellus redivivus TaxID=6233 RepID=A0A7E4V921_PANRE
MSTPPIPTDAPESTDDNGNNLQPSDDQASPTVKLVRMADPVFMERFFGAPKENQPYECTLKIWPKVREFAEAFIRGETRTISETPLPGVNEHLWNRLLEMRPDAGRVTAAGPTESPVTRSLRLRNQPRMSYDTNALYDVSMQKQQVEQQKADAQKSRRGQWRSNTPQVRSGSVARKTLTARFERATTVQPASVRPTLVDMEPSSSTVWKKPALPVRYPASPGPRSQGPQAPFVFPNSEIAKSTPGNSPANSPVAPIVPVKPRRGRPPNALRFGGPQPRPPPPPAVKADITPPQAAAADPPKRRGRPPKIHRENTFNSVLSIAQAAQQQEEVQPEVEVEVIEQRSPSPQQQRCPLKVKAYRRRSTHRSPAVVPVTINPNPYQPFTASGGAPKRANTRAPTGTPANKQLRFHEPVSSDSSSSIEVLLPSGSSPRRPITQTTNSVKARSTPHVQNGITIPTTATTAIPVSVLPSVASGQAFAFPNGNVINGTQVLVGGGPGLQGMVPITMDAAVALQMHPPAAGGQIIPVLPVVKSGTGQYVDITFFQDKVRELQTTMATMQSTMNLLQDQNRALAGVQAENRTLIENLRSEIRNLAISNGTNNAASRSSASTNPHRSNVKQEPRD